MSNCPTCHTELPGDHFAIIGKTLEDFRDWSAYESTYSFPGGKTFNIPGLGDVKLVKKSTECGSLDSYGDIPSGVEFETFIIFEINGRYFRKEGTGDSYGRVTWNGTFKEVFPKAKTVTVYEFEN